MQFFYLNVCLLVFFSITWENRCKVVLLCNQNIAIFHYHFMSLFFLIPRVLKLISRWVGDWHSGFPERLNIQLYPLSVFCILNHRFRIVLSNFCSTSYFALLKICSWKLQSCPYLCPLTKIDLRRGREYVQWLVLSTSSLIIIHKRDEWDRGLNEMFLEW